MITPEETRRARQPVDFVNVNSLLSDEEKEIRDRVREHVDREIVPVMADYWDKAEFPFDLIPGLGELGIMGGSFEKEYGCAGWTNLAYGLAVAELGGARGAWRPFWTSRAAWRWRQSTNSAARSKSRSGSLRWPGARRSAASALPSPSTARTLAQWRRPPQKRMAATSFRARRGGSAMAPLRTSPLSGHGQKMTRSTASSSRATTPATTPRSHPARAPKGPFGRPT